VDQTIAALDEILNRLTKTAALAGTTPAGEHSHGK
jgi:hypothetical protein